MRPHTCKGNSCSIDEKDSGRIYRMSWDLCEHSIYMFINHTNLYQNNQQSQNQILIIHDIVCSCVSSISFTSFSTISLLPLIDHPRRVHIPLYLKSTESKPFTNLPFLSIPSLCASLNNVLTLFKFNHFECRAVRISSSGKRHISLMTSSA